MTSAIAIAMNEGQTVNLSDYFTIPDGYEIYSISNSNGLIIGGTGNDRTFTTTNGTGDRAVAPIIVLREIDSGVTSTHNFSVEINNTMKYGKTTTGNDRIDGTLNDDTLSGGDGDDFITGGRGHDTLNGDAGADTLKGEAGNDIIYGGGGGDTLTGGTGADIFVFKSTTDSSATTIGRDTITDFSKAQGDKIDLSEMDANINLAGDQAFVFTAGNFTKVAGQVRVVNGNVISGDVDGDGKADFAINLTTDAPLTASDFLL